MSTLSDASIIEYIQQGRLQVHPLIEDNVQPASVDLRLGTTVRKFLPDESFYTGSRNDQYIIDPQHIEQDKIYGPEKSTEGDGFILAPMVCVIADTIEYVGVPDDLQAEVFGRSSLGRLGLFIHISAGFIDPGFHGTITLEMFNVGEHAIRLRSGLRVAQIAFHELTTPADIPYGSERGSKYNNQRGPTVSRVSEDRENK